MFMYQLQSVVDPDLCSSSPFQNNRLSSPDRGNTVTELRDRGRTWFEEDVLDKGDLVVDTPLINAVTWAMTCAKCWTRALASRQGKQWTALGLTGGVGFMPYVDPQIDRKVDPHLKYIGHRFYLFGDRNIFYGSHPTSRPSSDPLNCRALGGRARHFA